MKELVISIILFITVITLVVFNAFYVTSTAETLKSLAKQATENASVETLSALVNYWNIRRNHISLSAGLREVDSVTENLVSLKVALEDGDFDRINQSYALLCNAIDDITRYERLSFVAIF